MSRSNPTEGRVPNPATRWFEWNGEHGVVRYYDRDTKKNVDVGSDFQFILLDELGSVRGFHDASNSGIYSNEVKDTAQEVLVVKANKAGTLAEGVYRDIKHKVNAFGGQYVASCYIAYKNDRGELSIGSLRFKGSALGAWMEFKKAHKVDLYTSAIRIKGFNEGKKGRIVFRTPVLQTAAISPETDRLAIALDKELQEFFASYLKRPKRDVADDHEEQSDAHVSYNPDDDQYDEPVQELIDDDIPF